MAEHRKAAHKVPARVFTRLKQELIEREGFYDVPYVGIVRVYRDKAG